MNIILNRIYEILIKLVMLNRVKKSRENSVRLLKEFGD